ncbi:NHL repeat protein [Oopsacas minuta]|uniref:NHL repeat protein n=1 Tax=Oopsacas minuta TaxID=111878 RepID=A0AAV7JX96_9METZ|nr:NHL repeat protein [Oopsacas minuta]
MKSDEPDRATSCILLFYIKLELNSMACNIQEPDEVVYVSDMEDLIHNTFDKIISKVNLRREKLISQFRDIQTQKNAIFQSIDQLKSARSILQEKLRINPLSAIQQRTTADIDGALANLQLEASIEHIFVCNEKNLDNALTRLGGFELQPNQYIAKSIPKFAFGADSKSSLRKPVRLSVDESLDLIAVTDSISKQIYLFSLEGKYLNSFGKDYFAHPCAIKIINHNEILVTDYQKEDMSLIQYERGKKEKFKLKLKLNERRCITSLDYDKNNNQIYATESITHSLLIFNKEFKIITDLNNLFLFPQNVVITDTEIYIQDHNNPCFHILSKYTLEFSRSLISRGLHLSTESPLSFTIDQKGCIIIGDKSGVIQVYAPSGQLIHTFAKKGTELGEVYSPTGIFVRSNYDVIVISNSPNYPIQVF